LLATFKVGRLVLLLSLALTTSSCVRGGFYGTPNSDSTPAFDNSIEGDSSTQSCQNWGPFSAPTLLSAVNSQDDDWGPSLGSNSAVLMFASYRLGGPGGGDIWQALRQDPHTSFSTPTLVSNINSASYEASPVLSVDGLTLLFGSARSGSSTEIWITTRTSVTDNFSPPSALSTVNAPGMSLPQHLSPDSHTLWLTSDKEATLDIYLATRPDGESPFSGATPVASLNSPDAEHSFTLSSDGLEAIFSSDRPGGAGLLDLWLARRPEPTHEFEPPQNLSMLNTSNDDTFARLSPDGRTLYFNRDSLVAGGRSADIWLSHRSCDDKE